MMTRLGALPGHRWPTAARTAAIFAAVLTVVLIPAASTVGADPDVPVADGDGIDTATARARALAADNEVDLLIDEADLDQWIEATIEDPDLFDGLIGVILDPVDHPSGPSAAALDEAVAEAEAAAAVAPPLPPPAECVGYPFSARPSASELTIHLACSGDEPVTRSLVLQASADLAPDERVAAALEALATAERADDGTYSLLLGHSDLIQNVTVSADVASIDFAPGLADLGFDRSMAASTTLLEQLINTIFANSDVVETNFTIEGDCAAFWRAMGGVGCHHAFRADHESGQETEGRE